MTPDELAELHPKLFHVTTSGARSKIERFGLMSTVALLEFLEVAEAKRTELTTRRRPKAVIIPHPAHGDFVIGDNGPLSEVRLKGRLEGDLTFSEWLLLLNRRVFFWTDEERVGKLAASRLNKGTSKEVLVLDTLRLSQAHSQVIEIAPFNTGSTGRQPKPPVRGVSTFTPIRSTEYPVWRRKRGQRDRIVEVVVPGCVPDVADFILEVKQL